MILIISTPNDVSTSKVIDFLIQKTKSYFRINDNASINIISISTDDFNIAVQGKAISSREIDFIWFRKGTIKAALNLERFRAANEPKFIECIQKNETIENNIFINHIIDILEGKENLAANTEKNFNKLNVLRQASLLGIKIPESYILTTKNEINHRFNHNQRLVTKTISPHFFYIIDSAILASYTTIIDRSTIPSEFAPSLVQEYIDKEYEIRSFFLNGSFYSMAVFPNELTKDEIDIRKYSFQNTRNVPYRLPKAFEEKLLILMNKLGLDTGSIDIIKSRDGTLFFLEINPAGLFDDVSHFCNYYLEKLVAEHLSN